MAFDWKKFGQQVVDEGKASGSQAWHTGVDDYGKADISTQIMQGIASGAGADVIKTLRDQRQGKAQAGGDAYAAYVNDDVYKIATEYINSQSEPVQPSRPSYSGGSSYSRPVQQASPYKAQIDALTAQLLGRDKFQYDVNADPLYQQYRKQYTREGERAMQNVLGQMAARTGGMPSSYAQAAAQQTYNDYLSRLGDKIPELYQIAWDKYTAEGDDILTQLNTLVGLDNTQYNRYLDTLSQYNKDRDFQYNAWRDEVGDGQWQQSFDYQAGRDQMDDQWKTANSLIAAEQEAYDRSQYQDETTWKRAYQRAQELAAYGDFSGFEDPALGYTAEQVQAMRDAYAREQALAMVTGGKSSGGSTGGKSSNKGGSTGTSGGVDWSDVENWANRYGEESAEDYIREHYKEMGYSAVGAALAGWNNHLLEMGGAMPPAATDGANNTVEASTGKGPLSTALELAQAQFAKGGDAERLRVQLTTIPGLTDANKTAMIRDALDNRRITEEEADWLLDYLGY